MEASNVYFQFKPYYNKPSDEVALLRDIVEITCPLQLKEKIESLVIFPNGINKTTRVTAVQIIQLISVLDDNIMINSVGVPSVLYEPKNQNNENKLFTFFKVTFAAILLFVGSALAIIYFHSDVQMNKAHELVYFLLTGKKVERPLLMSVSYSIGIALGIAIFFDVFNLKKKKVKPGPLELELFQSDKDLKDYLNYLEGKK